MLTRPHRGEEMRVRIAKRFWWKDRNVTTTPGQVMNVPDEVARLWLRHGMAMEDRTVDVPVPVVEMTETKAGPPPEPKPLPPDVVRPKKRKVRRAKK